jgi:DNA-binding NarL/FixJ family response regulator
LTECSHARWREAQALLQAGERWDVAAPPLRAAHAISTRIGFVPLTAAIEDLARRARINLGSGAESSSPTSPAKLLGLTAREREVLERLAAGRTNRQIADELFISTKTASVHVSNILAKLGVANRGEAAARARDLGFDRVSSH